MTEGHIGNAEDTVETEKVEGSVEGQEMELRLRSASFFLSFLLFLSFCFTFSFLFLFCFFALSFLPSSFDEFVCREGKEIQICTGRWQAKAVLGLGF